MTRRKVVATFFTILILGISLCPLAGLVSETEAGTLPIIYVDCRGKTGTEIGVALGNAMENAVGADPAEIEAQIDSFLTYSIPGQWIFDYGMVPRVNVIKPNIDQKYRDEVNALASFFDASSNPDKLGDGKVSLNEFWVLQLIPDIARMTNCSGFGVFGNCSASGLPIVGRSLDWGFPPGIRNMQAITVYQYEDRTFVNIGFAGLAGVLTGFNSDGLFAGILDSPMGAAYPDPPVGKRSFVFDLRNALETCTEISEAATALYNQQYAFSHNILFADTTDVQVLEHPQGINGSLRTFASVLRSDISWGKTNQIAVVNFFALSGYSNGSSYWNYDRWNRFQTLADFNATDNRAHAADVMNIMLDTANGPNQIFNNITVQSMVFTPAGRKLYLYTVPESGIHDSNPVMSEITIMLSISGDINNDGSAGLTDAILALQVISGIEPSTTVHKEADVNGDGKIGIEEVIYILQKISGLRQ